MAMTYTDASMYEGEYLYEQMKIAETTAWGCWEDEYEPVDLFLHVCLDGKGIVELEGAFPRSYSIHDTYTDALQEFGFIVSIVNAGGRV